MAKTLSPITLSEDLTNVSIMINYLDTKTIEILYYIAKTGEVNLYKLSEGTGQSFSTIYNKLIYLIKMDLVEERRGPKNARILSLTEKGWKLIDLLCQIEWLLAEDEREVADICKQRRKKRQT